MHCIMYVCYTCNVQTHRIMSRYSGFHAHTMHTIDPASLSYMYGLELLVCRPVARDGKPHPSYSTTKSGIAKYVSLLFHILSCE